MNTKSKKLHAARRQNKKFVVEAQTTLKEMEDLEKKLEDLIYYNWEIYNMRIMTHNKKFIYEVDNEKNVIQCSSNNCITNQITKTSIAVRTGRGIISMLTTPNDKYLFVLSAIERLVYKYSINSCTGELIKFSPVNYPAYKVQELFSMTLEESM